MSLWPTHRYIARAVAFVCASGYWLITCDASSKQLPVPVEKDGKWVYVESDGKTQVPGEYDGACSYSEGLASVRVGDKWGFIDEQGRTVIPPKFDWTSNFRESLAAVSLNRACGYIDRLGTMIIKPFFSSGGSFAEGLAAASVKQSGVELWGYIDKTGNFAILPHFSYASPFSHGWGLVQHTNCNYSFIDRDGKMQGAYSFAHEFSEGLAAVCSGGGFYGTRGGLWGYIDTNGTAVIEFQFQMAYSFREGLAAVNFGGKYGDDDWIRFAGGRWGFIDKRGAIVLQPQWEDAKSFSEGLCPVRLGGRYGYISHKGNLMIPLQFSEAGEFKSGLARVRTGASFSTEEKRSGYINKTGKWVLFCEPKDSESENSAVGTAGRHPIIGPPDRDE